MNRRRILLIDADPGFHEQLAGYLSRHAFAVVNEADPDNALNLASVDPPALLIVGVDEPDKLGFKVFQRCKKGALARVPVVLVTSTVGADSFAKHRALKVHADEYIDKRTLTRDELLNKVDALIGLGEAMGTDASLDSLDIPVEVDDIPLAEGDMVLDEELEEVGDDFGDDPHAKSSIRARPAELDVAAHPEPATPAAPTTAPEPRRAGRVSSPPVIDSTVDAEIEDAFGGLLGGDDGDPGISAPDAAATFVGDDVAAVDAGAADESVPQAVEDELDAAAADLGETTQVAKDPSEAGAIPTVLDEDPNRDFEDVAGDEELNRDFEDGGQATQAGGAAELAAEVNALGRASEPVARPQPVGSPYVSSPSIALDDADLQPLEDEVLAGDATMDLPLDAELDIPIGDTPEPDVPLAANDDAAPPRSASRSPGLPGVAPLADHEPRSRAPSRSPSIADEPAQVPPSLAETSTVVAGAELSSALLAETVVAATSGAGERSERPGQHPRGPGSNNDHDHASAATDAGSAETVVSPSVGREGAPRRARTSGQILAADIGLDAVAEQVEREQSGPHDRRMLRKVDELERQVTQLKAELERARASDSSTKPVSREGEFLKLRETLSAQAKDLQRTKDELSTKDRTIATLEAELAGLRTGRSELDARRAELQQRVDAEASRASTAESKEQALSAQLATVQRELAARISSLEEVEAAREQLDRDLANERALRASNASEAERALRLEREQLIARHQGELAQLRAAADAERDEALEAARTEIDARHAAAITVASDAARSAVSSEHQAELARLARAHAEAIERLQGDAATVAGKLEDELLEARTERNEALASVERLENELLEARTERNEASASLQRLEAELGSTRADRERVTSQTAQAHEQLAEVRGQLDALRAAAEAAAAEAAAVLATTRDEHEQLLVTRATEHARALGTQREEHEQALAAQRAEHEGKVNALETQVAELRTQLDQVVTQAREETARQRDAHQTEIGRLTQTHRDEVAHLKADRERAADEQARKLETTLAALREDHRLENEAAQARFEADLETAGEQHAQALEQALEQARASATRERDELLARVDAAARRARELEAALAAATRSSEDAAAAHEETVAELRSAHEAAIAELRAAHDARVRDLTTSHDAKLAELTRSHEATIGDLARRHEAAIDEARAASDAALADLENAHSAAISELRGSHDAALAELTTRHERATEAANAERARVVAAKDAEHAAAVSSLRAEHARIAADLTGERDELRTGLSSARESLRRVEGELASAVAAINVRDEELRSHLAAIGERDQRISELRREIETIEQENASYQDQVLRAYQKIKTDEAMVARAKKAMAIALTVLDDPAPKQ